MAEIAILGGAGELGRALAARLAHAGRPLVLLDRGGPALERAARECGARALAVELPAPEALAQLARSSALLVHCAGPFRGQSDALARTCAELGATLIDASDDRGYCERVLALHDLAQTHGARLLCAGAAHALLTGAAVEALEEEFAALNEIWIASVPGGESRIGPARRASVESGRGQRMQMRLGGEWTEREVGGDERWAEFPASIGRSKVANLDAPETLLFTQGRRINMVRVSAALPPEGGRALLGKLLGKATRADEVLALWLRGTDNGRLPMERRLCLHGGQGTHALASIPLACLVERVLACAPIAPGARAASGLVEWSVLASALAASGVRELRGNLGGWRET